MVHITFYENRTNAYIKQWPNWSGVVPAVGDVVVLHFGDDNEEVCCYIVRERVIDGTKPEHIWLLIEQKEY